MSTQAAGTDSELSALQDLLSQSQGVFEAPENAAYLTELPSLPLSDLLATPASLTTQSHTITSSLTALTHTSYPTFLSLHKSSTALLGSLSSLDSSLNALLDTALPALDDAARVFREKSGPSVIEERQKTRVVLEQQDKLHDLLDIPILIDTCVRNGLYSEALMLATHATTVLAALCTLQSKEGDFISSSLQLARSLQDEVAFSLRSMRLLLLDTLFEPPKKLPAFWKAVQFLRRMQAMPEDELALTFASARIECLRSALQNLERDAGVSGAATFDVNDNITGPTAEDREKQLDRQADDVARFLKKYIDAWREGAYDIITQYTTIFLERSHVGGPSPSSSTAQPNPVIKQTLLPTLLSLLLPPLRTHLRRAYPHLAPLSTQLAYCSSAMARVGMDFRALLSQLLTQAVVDGFTRDLRIGANREWSLTLSKYTSGKNKSAAPSTWLVSAVQPLPSLSTLVTQSSAPAHIPPEILTSFPPLAVSLNTYLRSLNRLRLFVPVNAVNGVINALESSLSKAGQELFTYAVECGASDKELDILRAGGAAYARVMAPFLRRAVVEGVFRAPRSSQGDGDERMQTESGTKDHDALEIVLQKWEKWLGDGT
ncbi:Dor1-like family-domain-containing protein [Pisolithus tinctorius]|nr:Dor1-like family-domain-containing protein [Pisolithus tinctorius]